VLDASAILAIIHQEPGHEMLTPELLERAIVSSVNLAEVHSKLIAVGWTPDEAWEDATGAVEEIMPFTSDHARLAGNLITHTRPFGLSLADRACLALALQSKLAVYTADRSWKNLKLNLRIHVIR
jgi:PIN domain nuclease of toxin-antitoxin system